MGLAAWRRRSRVSGAVARRPDAPPPRRRPLRPRRAPPDRPSPPARRRGATKAAVCRACHGPQGNSANPDWPRLAGQSAVYIAAQLHLFRAGVRDNPMMKPMAAALSDQDIGDLAVYYEAQTPRGLEADPSYWKAGEALYVSGDPARDVPACVACHGPVGRGNLAAGYPALRAQQSVYVIKQLNDYASGARYTGGAARSGPQQRDDAHDRQAPDARGDPRRGLLRAGHALKAPGADSALLVLAALLTLLACHGSPPAAPAPAAPPAPAGPHPRHRRPRRARAEQDRAGQGSQESAGTAPSTPEKRRSLERIAAAAAAQLPPGVAARRELHRSCRSSRRAVGGQGGGDRGLLARLSPLLRARAPSGHG